MKRKEMLAYELTNNILFTDASYTYDEYVTYLLQLQATILKIFFGDTYDSHLRLNDAYSCLKQFMIKYKVINNNAYSIYEKAMKILERELAIALAGKNAENRIHHNHEEMATYRNVYLEHRKETCEIDEIILTAMPFFSLKSRIQVQISSLINMADYIKTFVCIIIVIKCLGQPIKVL